MGPPGIAGGRAFRRKTMNTSQLEYKINEQGMVLEYLDRLNRAFERSNPLFNENLDLEPSQNMGNSHSLVEEDYM